MTDPAAIIEAAARALFLADWGEAYSLKEMDEQDQADYRKLALHLVPAVTPLIRAAALEEAAQNFERYETEIGSGVAAAIRAWKEQP